MGWEDGQRKHSPSISPFESYSHPIYQFLRKHTEIIELTSINTSIFSNAILHKRPTECISRFSAKRIAWVLIYLVVQLGKCCNINCWKIKDSSNCRKKIKWSRKMRWERNNLGGWNWRGIENSCLEISRKQAFRRKSQMYPKSWQRL